VGRMNTKLELRKKRRVLRERDAGEGDEGNQGFFE